MKRLAKYFPYLVIALWAVACFAYFHLAYPYHFFFQEQNQLFLHSADYVATYFDKPAWLACLSGDFLTQYYYYFYAGPAIITVVMLVIGDFIRRSLNCCGLGRWAFWIAIATMTLLAFSHLNAAYRLPSDMALMGGLVAFLIYYLIQALLPVKVRNIGSTILLLILTALTYWAFGWGCWVLAALAALHAFMHQKRMLIGCLLSIILLAVSAPLTTNSHYRLFTYKNLTYPGLPRPSLPETALEQFFRVDNEYYFGHHNHVANIVEQTKTPLIEEKFFYALVQAQKGELPDHLFSVPRIDLGTFYRIGPNTPLFTIKMMNELYYALGDMTFTERAAMMGNVFAPHNRNVRMMKRLAECNLVSSDTLAAMKYLRILKQTTCYRQWADDHTPGQMTPTVEAEIMNKRKFANRTDTLQVNDNLHMVMTELLDSNPDNIVALDYMLCSDLLLKDMESFKRDYDRYCHERPRMKPLYQQALMIYLAGTNASEEQWKQYPFDNRQIQRFQEYNQHRGDSRFSDTYWYFFDKQEAYKAEVSQ